MIIHVARVLWPSVVVTDQLRHTRSFIGAYSSKSTLSVIVLVFLKIMAMERSRCRGGATDYKLHKTSSSIWQLSASSQGIVRNIVREKSGNFIFEFEWEPCAGSNLGRGYFAPRSTQPSVTPGSVSEYQLRLGRQRLQVWLIPIADERVGVQVKLWNPSRTRAIPERFCGGDSLRRGAISNVCTFTLSLPVYRASGGGYNYDSTAMRPFYATCSGLLHCA